MFEHYGVEIRACGLSNGSVFLLDCEDVYHQGGQVVKQLFPTESQRASSTMKLMTGKTVGKLKKKKLKEAKTVSLKLEKQISESITAEQEDLEDPVTPTAPARPTMFGDVTSICYVESHTDTDAIAFGTSNGFISVVLKLNEDLTKASNRVETFYIPNKERINCVRGLCMQAQQDESELKAIYNFLVLTNANLYSIQTDIDVEKQHRTKDMNPIDIKNQYVKKSKSADVEFDTQFGLYSCFKQGTKGGNSCLIGIVVDKDLIVLLDPLTFEKKIVYKMPALDLNINFSQYLYADRHASLLAFSKHIVHQMSFKPLTKGVMAVPSPPQSMPTEIEVPKPIILFGKHISIENSLEKWEHTLNTNTLTNFDEAISM